jgi:hypothetical protein
MEKGNDKLTNTEVEIEDDLQPSVSPLVCLGVGLPSGVHDQIFVLSDNCRFLDVDGLSDERMGLEFTRTIASGPCQSNHSWVQVPQNSRPYFTFSYETLPTWKARSPYLYLPGTGWPSYTLGHWVPFSSSRLTGLWWRYSNLPPHWKVDSTNKHCPA